MSRRASPPPVTPMEADVARTSGFSTLAAFLRRDLQVAVSYRVPFVLDAGSALFQVALFFFLSRIVDQAGVPAFQRLEGGYFAFVIIGLVVMRIIDTALNTFSSSLRIEQTLGTFEALIASPTRLPLVVLGSSAYDLLYATATGAFMFTLAVAWGVRLDTGVWAVLVALVAVAAALVLFAALGLVVAAFVVVFKQGGSAIGLLSQLLALLSGVYFPITVFPAWLQAVAQLLPFTWALEVLRATLLRGELPIAHTALLALCASVALPLAFRLLRAAVDRARRSGTLAHY